jgi:hypothetical protein
MIQLVSMHIFIDYLNYFCYCLIAVLGYGLDGPGFASRQEKEIFVL